MEECPSDNPETEVNMGCILYMVCVPQNISRVCMPLAHWGYVLRSCTKRISVWQGSDMMESLCSAVPVYVWYREDAILCLLLCLLPVAISLCRRRGMKRRVQSSQVPCKCLAFKLVS